MAQRRNWDSVDESVAVAPGSQRGGVAYGTALQPAISREALTAVERALPVAAGAGSGNFTFSAPVVRYPGRGQMPLSLSLVYNSRLWQRLGTAVEAAMVFDIDQDWPAPGWLLSFGRLICMRRRSAMLVEGDGTRHPFAVMDRIVYGSGNVATNAYTLDGSAVVYTSEEHPVIGRMRLGRATYPDGTQVTFGAPAGDQRTLYATQITDRNGNCLAITYRGGHGPQPETITDTCGRVVRFHYDAADRLVCVTGPGPGDGQDVQLVRLHYASQVLARSFTPDIVDIDAPTTPISLVDAIYYPGTGTGYWFGDPGDLSSYGMLRRVRGCRGMSISTAALNDQGTISRGLESWLREYDYPAGPGVRLPGAPTYTQMAESWVGKQGPQIDVTKFKVSRDAEATSQTTQVTRPDGSRTVQVVALAAPRPGELKQSAVYDADDHTLQMTTFGWGSGPDGSARVEQVNVTDGRGSTVKTTYKYNSPTSDAPSDVLEWDFTGLKVLRRTHTDFVTDAQYLARHRRRLPRQVLVYDERDTICSWTEYRYDEHGLRPRPGVVGLDERFDPDKRTWVEPVTEREENPHPPPPFIDVTTPGYWKGPFDPATRWRGNVTTVLRYADAAGHRLPVTSMHHYDLVGNLLTTDVGVGRSEWVYEPTTQFLGPSRFQQSAAPPFPSAVGMVVSSTRYNRDGKPNWIQDAFGNQKAIGHDAAGRVRQILLASTQATLTIDYDDVAMTQRWTIREGGTGTVASQEMRIFDGKGRMTSVRRAAPDGGWFITDYQYDGLGRLSAHTAPHRDGGAGIIWGGTVLDPLNRPVRSVDPDGGVTTWAYNEVAAAPYADQARRGPTALVTDPGGHETWLQFDEFGRLAQVVDPKADSDGKVFWNGLNVTSYSYNGNGNVIEIFTGRKPSWAQPDPWPRRTTQIREFAYDGLGRLTYAYLPERGAGIPAPNRPHGWSVAYSYDERSNLTAAKDSRGVITHQDYNGDPLDRLQRIRYDLSEFTDVGNPVLPCPDVVYGYPQGGDIRQVASELAVGTCKQTFIYDHQGLRETTLTMLDATEFPFTFTYGKDSLGRVTSRTYPQRYGETVPLRTETVLEYGLGDAPAHLTIDGVDAATGFTYHPSGQIRSLDVGPPGPQQVTESYDYQMWHHWLQHVQLNQNGETLLNLTYHYRPAILATAEGGLAGQVSRRVDNLDDANSRSYAYDALGRLVLATGGPHEAPLWTQRYGYDFWGNRTTTTATGELGSSWEIPDGQRNLAYDEPRNQITSNGVRYDAAGNQLSTLPSNVGSGQCQYDAAGRLAVVRDGLGKEISRFVYGACNRRRATVSGEYGWTRYHVWDGDQVIAGYESPAGAATSVQWRSSMVFLGPRLLAHQQNLGATWWTLYEHPGLIGTAYVTGPDVHDATLTYLTSFGGNNDATPVRAFASYSRDRATGLDYAVNRYYDSGMGRFLQPDPLGFLSFRTDDPRSLNLYAYCSNDPINREDPLGLEVIRMPPEYIYGCVYENCGRPYAGGDRTTAGGGGLGGGRGEDGTGPRGPGGGGLSRAKEPKPIDAGEALADTLATTNIVAVAWGGAAGGFVILALIFPPAAAGLGIAAAVAGTGSLFLSAVSAFGSNTIPDRTKSTASGASD